MCEEYLGVPGKTTAFVFGMVAFIGAVIVYWVLMTNFLYNVGTYIHGKFCLSWMRCTL